MHRASSYDYSGCFQYNIWHCFSSNFVRSSQFLPHQDLLLGRQCCVDLMGSTTSNKPNWEKICCDNEHGPFKKPPSDISQEDLDKLDKQIPRMQGLPPEVT